MHPILFQYWSGHHLHLRRAGRRRDFCRALVGVPSARRARASTPIVVWNLGMYGILVALAVSKIWLHRQPVGLLHPPIRAKFSASGRFNRPGHFMEACVGGILWVIFYTRLHKLLASRRARSLRRSGGAGARDRSPRLLCRRLLLRQADIAVLGRHLFQSHRGEDQRHAVGRLASSHAVVRIRC